MILKILFYFGVWTIKLAPRIGNKGIELQQSEQFNESFKWLFRETMLAAAMFVLQTIMLSMATLLNFKLLVNMH